MTTGPICKKCFRRLEPDAEFCGNCGTPVAEAPEQPTTPGVSSVSGGVCPSCHHRNDAMARFCERCGTQLSSMSGAPASAPGAPASVSGSPAQDNLAARYARGAETEDPWATGPGYQAPPRPDQVCPRCGSFRNPGETACVNCGLPFGEQLNYYGVPPAVAQRGNPAGFWIRFLALIIDGVIVALIGTVLWPLLFGDTFWPREVIEFDDGSTFDSISARNWIHLMTILYHTFFLALFGATPGKRLLGIRIYDANGRQGIGFVRAAIRTLSTYISTFTLLIGYIMAAFRRDKRALHDLIAGTYPTRV